MPFFLCFFFLPVVLSFCHQYHQLRVHIICSSMFHSMRLRSHCVLQVITLLLCGIAVVSLAEHKYCATISSRHNFPFRFISLGRPQRNTRPSTAQFCFSSSVFFPSPPRHLVAEFRVRVRLRLKWTITNRLCSCSESSSTSCRCQMTFGWKNRSYESSQLEREIGEKVNGKNRAKEKNWHCDEDERDASNWKKMVQQG